MLGMCMKDVVVAPCVR